MDEFDNENIKYVDFHEEIEDVKRRLGFLESDSYNHLRRTLCRNSFQPADVLYSEVQYLIEIANDIKHAIKSILLYYSTSNPTPIPTDLIPCIKDIRPRLIHLLLRFNDDLKKTCMEVYEHRAMWRLKKAMSLLDEATGLVVDDQDSKRMIIMANNVVNKVMKERYEEIIKVKKSMEELEQVLFEMYVMVETQFIRVVLNGGGGTNGSARKLVHKNVEALVRRGEELRWKNSCAYFRRFCIIYILGVVVVYYILIWYYSLDIWARPLPSASTN